MFLMKDIRQVTVCPQGDIRLALNTLHELGVEFESLMLKH